MQHDPFRFSRPYLGIYFYREQTLIKVVLPREEAQLSAIMEVRAMQNCHRIRKT